MSASHPEFEEQTKAVTLRFLTGEDLALLQIRLTSLTQKSNQSCRALFKSVPVEADDPYIQVLLSRLGIEIKPEDKTSHYAKLVSKSSNLYELLHNLHHDGQHHLEYFLFMIDKTTPPLNWGAIFFSAAGLSALIGGLFWAKPSYYQATVNWIKGILPKLADFGRSFASNLKNVSLVAILYNTCLLAYDWYTFFTTGTTQKSYKINRLAFNTLASLLTISAYTVAFMTGGALATISSFLLILSASVDIFRGLYFFIKNAREVPSKPPESASRIEHETYLRAKNLRDRSLRSMALKGVVGALITAAVIITAFNPGSFIITASCFVFISLITIAQKFISNSIKKSYAEKLQTEIGNINKGQQENTLSHAKALSKIHYEWKKIGKERAALEVQKAELAHQAEEVQAFVKTHQKAHKQLAKLSLFKPATPSKRPAQPSTEELDDPTPRSVA